MSCRKWEVQIVRWQEGVLDRDAERLLLRHLAGCVHCRTLAAKFSEVDALVSKSPEPSLPLFLKERIVGTVSEAMRQDAASGTRSTLFAFLASFRPAVVAAALVLGIGIGVATGWDLARSVMPAGTSASPDLVSLAGIGGEGNGSSLEFIWTDDNGRTGR